MQAGAYSSGGGGGTVNGDGCGAPLGLRLHTPAGHSRRRAASQQHLIVVVVVAEAFARAVCPVSAACSERGRGVGRASCRRWWWLQSRGRWRSVAREGGVGAEGGDVRLQRCETAQQVVVVVV